MKKQKNVISQTVQEHTPGPWSIREFDTRYGEPGEVYEVVYLDNHICLLSEGRYHFELEQGELLANAKLIARAPEMASEITSLKAENERYRKALSSIRHATYDRDTDDSILHNIGGILTDAGFPYEQED